VPGKTPFEAVREYRDSLQQSLSCLSRRILRTSGCEPNALHEVVLSQPTAQLITRNQETLHLTFVQAFSIIEPLWSLPFRFKVRTRAYWYGLEDRHHTEIVAFHWHPEDTSAIGFPHFHLRQAAGQFRPELGKIHFRTDRFAFEEFCLLLIEEFRVIPDRDDAKEVLEKNLKLFKQHKTW